ncbi:MAG: RsmB/NOP family class I SAM-dependent RNA methyltransferase [Rhizobiales bacterium]|nr:RsmB/NOP family class I SAM-dependent RNA methyltransferase [Hyphomicrobiales bacterium]
MKPTPSQRNPAPGRPRERAAAPEADRALASRRLAASAFRRVLEKGAALDDALAEAGARLPALDERDARLARSILTVALKRLGTLRQALDVCLKTPLAQSPPDLAAILTTAAAQLLFMGVPDHAAVDSAVALTRADRRIAGLSGVANAVLRRIAAERKAILDRHDPCADLPGWLIQRWRLAYGPERTARIAAALGQEPTLDITPLSDPEGWAERLGGRLLPTRSIRLISHDPVPALPGYADGAWFVQDAAAAIPARLLDTKPGERVLDLCAAPGGKTAQLAATGAAVTAIDRSSARLGRLRQNLARLGLKADIIAADAAAWAGEPADAILLDAPCASTGTIRRHPDVAWTKTETDIASLAALQARLLDHAAGLLKPGGRLVYSTCSLEPEEGERQIETLLERRRDLALDAVLPAEAPALGAAIDERGALRITPDLWPAEEARLSGLDGFYAARLRRVG